MIVYYVLVPVDCVTVLKLTLLLLCILAGGRAGGLFANPIELIEVPIVPENKPIIIREIITKKKIINCRFSLKQLCATFFEIVI